MQMGRGGVNEDQFPPVDSMSKFLNSVLCAVVATALIGRKISFLMFQKNVCEKGVNL